MRRQPSLRSQLNQIRMWVRQGRTDAWIAHKIDVSVEELARFKREHALEEGGEGARARPADPLSVPPPEPRSDAVDESEDDEDEDEEEAGVAVRERSAPRRRRRGGRGRRPARVRADEDEDDDEQQDVEERDIEEEDEDEAEEERRTPAARPRFESDDRDSADRDDTDRDDAGPSDGDQARRPRRRRGRRGGRRHRARRNAYEATFDHGGEGYGLWLDPAVVDNPVYSEHWAGHRAVTVTFDAETITIRRAAASGDDAEANGGGRERADAD